MVFRVCLGGKNLTGCVWVNCVNVDENKKTNAGELVRLAFEALFLARLSLFIILGGIY